MESGIAEELRRKFAHLLGVVWVIASFYLSLNETILVLAIFFFLSIITAALYAQLTRVPVLGRLIEFLHTLARSDERHAKFYYGAVYFFGSLAIVLFATQSLPIFRGAAIVLIFGDSISAIAGKAFGKTELPHNPYKSIEGSLTGLAAATIAASFVLPIPVAFFAAFIGMFVESVPWDLNDNLTIPLVVGFFLWVLTAL